MPEVATNPNVDERTRALLDALWADKEIGGKVRAKAKELYDDVVLPEDQIAPVLAPLQEQIGTLSEQLKAMTEERKAEREKIEQESFQRSFEERVQSAKSKYPNLTEEGLARAFERMKETNAYDPEAAMAWVVGQTPPETPKGRTPGTSQRLNLFGSSEVSENEKYRLLHTNPDRYIDAEISEFFQNPDAYVAETFALV